MECSKETNAFFQRPKAKKFPNKEKKISKKRSPK